MSPDDRDPQSTTNRLAQFEDRLPKKVFQPGAIIFRTGEMDDTAFIVRSGDVQVFTRNEGGQPVLLTTLGPGQILGELALLNERTRSATARTETGCELLVIKPQQIPWPRPAAPSTSWHPPPTSWIRAPPICLCGTNTSGSRQRIGRPLAPNPRSTANQLARCFGWPECCISFT